MNASPVATPPAAPAGESTLPPPRRYDYVLLGMVLVTAMAGTVLYFAYHGWYTQDIPKGTAYYGIGLPYLGLAAGLFSFSFGWQRGDMPRTIRMTFWLCVASAALIAAIILLFMLLRGSRAATAAIDAESDAAPGGHSSGATGILGHAFDDSDYFGRGGSTGWSFGGGVLGSPAGGGQQAVDSDRPLVIHCLHCGERYVPAPPKAICPYCGASAFAS